MPQTVRIEKEDDDQHQGGCNGEADAVPGFEHHRDRSHVRNVEDIEAGSVNGVRLRIVSGVRVAAKRDIDRGAVYVMDGRHTMSDESEPTRALERCDVADGELGCRNRP